MEHYLEEVTKNLIYTDEIKMEDFLKFLLNSSRYIDNVKSKLNKKSQYYIELEIRNHLVEELDIKIKRENTYKLMPSISDKEVIRKYLLYLKAEQDYKRSIENIELSIPIYDYKEEHNLSSDNNIFKEKAISMSELLNIEYLLTKKQYDMTRNITQSEIPNYELSQYARNIEYDIDDKQIFYYEVWDSIYDYMINSTEEFKKWSLAECGDTSIIHKKRYQYDLNKIIRDIFTDIRIVIRYLELAGDLDKYREQLKQYFQNNQPSIVLINQNLYNDISKYFYPNQIIDFRIDLKNDLKQLQNDLAVLHKQNHNKSKLDFLFKNEKIPVDYTASIDKKRKFRTMLFSFDAYLLGASIKSISTTLQMNNDENTAIDEKTIRKYIKEIQSLMLNGIYTEI